MSVQFQAGRYGAVLVIAGHRVSVILTAEFARRVSERKPHLARLHQLLTSDIREAVELLLNFPGTRSIEVLLRTKKTRINVPVVVARGDRPLEIRVVAKTVYVGSFIPYTDDYRLTFENPMMRVVFERDYQRALVDAVLADLQPRLRRLRPNKAYHLVAGGVNYIAEVERGAVLVPDARWQRKPYVFDLAG